jgi:RES domain-containing protein
VGLSDLPSDWRRREALTQQLGDAWHEARSATILRVPSVVVPIPESPDVNVVINHLHPDAGELRLTLRAHFRLTRAYCRIGL